MIPLTIDEAIDRLDRAATLGDTGRWQHYNRTTTLANQYSALATGELFDQFLVKFMREDPTGFNQRIALTVPKTPYLLQPAISQFHRTSRLQNIRRDLLYKDKSDDTRLKAIREAMAEFYAEDGVEEYLATVYDWVSLIDPNAYVVLEFDKTPAGAIEPYPVIFWSKMIYEPGRSNRRQLRYLLVELSAAEYLLYAGDFSMRYTRLPDKEEDRQAVISVATNVYTESPIFQPTDASGKPIGPPWLRQYYETKIPFVQAECLGYKLDPVTGFESNVSALEPAKYVLIDYVRTSSNFDYSKYLHVFPQKIEAVPPCPDCKSGYKPDGLKCNTCKGTGMQTSITQPDDTVRVPMKNGFESLKDVPDLAKLIYYVQVEMNTLDALDKNLQQLADAVHIAIFNNELVQRNSQVGTDPTATYTSVKREDINNTLMPFANHKSRIYRFLVRGLAVLVSDATFDESQLKVVYEFPKDLKPISVQEIYSDLETAIRSQAPNFEIEQLIKDLAEKRYEGDETGLRRIQVKLSHLPFIGLSWSQLVFLEGRGYVRKRDMVLYTYQDSVFADLERKNNDFYTMNYDQRDKLITDYIKQVIDELPESEMPNLNMGRVLPMPTTERPDEQPESGAA